MINNLIETLLLIFSTTKTVKTKTVTYTALKDEYGGYVVNDKGDQVFMIDRKETVEVTRE